MRRANRWGQCAILVGLLWVAYAAPSRAAEFPPFELDPTLSLTGDCTITTFDPVPDPSCTGEPLAYPPPPGGPSARFDEPRAIAIDKYGNEYVANWANSVAENGRIDVFDDEGKFITEIDVPEPQSIAVDSKGQLYVFEDTGSVVRFAPLAGYDPEAGEIEYDKTSVAVSSGFFVGALAIDTSPANLDQLLVVRSGTITRYSSAATGNSVIKGPDPLSSTWPYGLALDGQNERILVSYCKKESANCAVKILKSTFPYEQVGEIDGSTTPAEKFAAASGRLAVAVDEGTGDLFVADVGAKFIYQFAENTEYLSRVKLNDLDPNTSIQIAVSNGERSPSAEPCEYPDPEEFEVPEGDACNRHYLFVPALHAKETGGRAVAYRPPGQTPPVIKDSSVGGVGEDEAEMRASIFPGGLDTEYHFEITTLADFELQGFTGATSFGQGSISSESLTTSVSAFATGLVPGETYRFRVVAENELGKAAEEGQNEGTFTTYDDASASAAGSCPNEGMRLKASALLPDCRAYELVSPAETNGRPPKGTGFVGGLFTTLQASPAGDAVSFKIEGGSIPGTSGVASFEGDPYVSRRTDSGWTTELAGPTGEEATGSVPASTSPDQGYLFWAAFLEGPLVINGRTTQYLRYPDGHSELVGRGTEGSDPIAQGKLITEDATHVIFQTINLAPTIAVKLEPNAPPSGTETVYDRTIDPVTGAEETHTVSLLPGDITPAAGQNADYVDASKDGKGIAFEIGSTLYLRVGNETTFQIATGVEYAGISKDGERVFYVQGGNLKAFDTAGEEVIDFSSTGNVTPVNVAGDGARAYFVSPSVLGGANPEGEEAQAGEQNLYLSEEGEISFIATVTDRDVEGEPVAEGSTVNHDGLGLWTEVVGDEVSEDPSRTNPDGSVLLFQSRAEITGYPASEFPQIYRFDSGAEELQCISCIPTGVAATGGAALESYTFDSFSSRPFSPNAFIPNLTTDGTRAFFESTEALVSADTDEVRDVYEWEANEVGSCTRPEGCVYLISSGQSARENFLYGHSTSGDDVFFTTGDQLTGWDSSEGTASIYDAKVGGGFPEPPSKDICVGDGCRPQVTPAPDFGKPRAGGEGDVPPKAKICPKNKRKVKKNGKVQCVKKKQKKHKGGKAKQRAGANRGAGK